MWDEPLFTARMWEKGNMKVGCRIDHFTIVCSVTWPLNDSEAGGDLVLIKTSLSLLCRSSFSYAN